MATAPYYYFGDKSFAEMVYPELKDANYDEYMRIRAKYRQTFINSRPYNATISAKGVDRFGGEWSRTLKNLKALYGYEAPGRKPRTWSTLLRSEGM